MKRNIDELLKQKYKEIKYEDNLDLDFKSINKVNNIYKVAAILLLLVAVGIITVKIYVPGQKLVADNDINDNTNLDYEQELVQIVPEYQIVMDSQDIAPYTSSIGYATSYYTSGIDVEYVLAIRINKIIGYTNYSQIQDKYSIPVTKFEAEVLKCFKGKIEGKVEINTLGGIVSLADYEKTLNDVQKEKMGYNEMTQEYKEKTYVEIITSINLDRAKPEVGKVYLVCLDEDIYMYGGLRTVGVYAMKEYDIAINSIKENNGEWTNIEDIKILNDVIKNKP